MNINYFPPQIFFFIIPLLIWDLFWRGLALWHASQRGQKYWFIALFLVNSLGFLPLIYLTFFQKPQPVKAKEPSEHHFAHYAGFLLVSFIILTMFVLRFVLGGGEDTWIYQKGQWIKHGRPSAPKPQNLPETWQF